MALQKLTILGSTGSIGVNTLDVIRRHRQRYQVIALCAHQQIDRLYDQCLEFSPRFAVVGNAALAADLQRRLVGAGCSTLVEHGSEALVRMAELPDVDSVMAAIVGAAGLPPTLAAAVAGKKVLLANKEALVMAGPVFMRAVREHGATLLPIDSEHNAIFQSLPHDYTGDLSKSGVRNLLLTASGGPFLRTRVADLERVTPEQACAHPNWVMGRKISVDSATMMNKGLEMIEAHWLFNVPAEQIEVVIHPQSVIHSLVQYVDGSVIAELGNPDMRTPIAHALAYPQRIAAGVEPLDLFKIASLHFERPDFDRFPCLALAYRALREGHSAPAALNAANEIAVAAFLDGRIGFTAIPKVICAVIDQAPIAVLETLADVLAADHAARRIAELVISEQLSGMSNFLYYLAAFALVLGVLIIVHEYGHYIVARCAGVKVLRFSVGFGRVVWSKRIGLDGTEWAISLFPLGGYVKMLDEREAEVAPEELHRSFNRQSVWRRMAIVVAGPLANLVLAVVVYWGLFWYGSEELKPVLGTPALSSPAAAAGFENGERVLKVGGEFVQTWQEMRWVLLRRAVDQDVIDFEVINRRSEIALRRLNVSAAREDGWEGDALEKLGVGFFRPKIPAVIGQVSEGSAASAAGLYPGDEILLIDGTPVTTWPDVVRSVRSSPGKSLDFEVERNAQRYLIVITPAVVEDNGMRIGRIGASVKDPGFSRSDLMVTVRYGPLVALGKAIDETWDKSVFSLVMMGKMITGEMSWRNISGPVTIADYAGQSAKLGIGHYLKFLALVSISLAVLNLLPVPILDGGHLLYYVLEIIKRGPLSERSMEIGQQIGLALMLMLMACAFYNDINRLTSG